MCRTIQNIPSIIIPNQENQDEVTNDKPLDLSDDMQHRTRITILGKSD